MRDFYRFVGLEETVEKFNAVKAKEPELRKRYLAAMETLRVNLPPADEEVVPHKNAEALFRSARRIREGAVGLANADLDPRAVADATDKHAIWEKTKISVRRELRAISDEVVTDFESLLWDFYDDGIYVMHQFKKLAKKENNPNGYYTEHYRRIYNTYRKAQRALTGRKLRKIVSMSRAGVRARALREMEAG